MSSQQKLGINKKDQRRPQSSPTQHRHSTPATSSPSSNSLKYSSRSRPRFQPSPRRRPFRPFLLADGNPLIPYAAENNITNLSGVTITNANLSASEIPALDYLPLSGGTLTGTLSVPTLDASSTNYGVITATNSSTTNFSNTDTARTRQHRRHDHRPGRRRSQSVAEISTLVNAIPSNALSLGHCIDPKSRNFELPSYSERPRAFCMRRSAAFRPR